MNILVLGSIGRTSVEMAGFCKNAFEQLGHNAKMVVYNDRRLTSRWPMAKLLEKPFSQHRLLKRIKTHHPDFILAIKGDSLDEPFLNRIRELFRIPIVNYWIDDPLYLPFSTKISPSFDIFFTNAAQCVNAHKQAGCKNVHFLSFGFDAKLHRKMKLSESEVSHFGSDVSHSGTLSSERVELLTRLAGLNLKIWSKPETTNLLNFDFFSTLLPHDHPLQPHITGSSVWGDDMIRVCNASKIVLNLHVQDTPTMRDFETTACGAFLLTNYVKSLEDFFIIGKEIECFSSKDELIQKTSYYLDHPKERQMIADAGYARTCRDHDYTVRMKQIIEAIKTLPGYACGDCTNERECLHAHVLRFIDNY